MKRILVPLDGSELAELALEPARRLARKWGAELVLLRVTEPFVHGPLARVPSQTSRWLNAEVRPYLERVACDLAEEGFAVRTLFPRGVAREQIIRAARRQAAELIIMCSHGRSGVLRWLMGSVAEGVLRRAACPILIVRPGLAAMPEDGYHQVLVPVDGSPLADEVVERIRVYLAAAGQCTVVAATNMLPLDLDKEAREDTARALETDLAERFPDLPRQVFDGDASDVILTYATDAGCDLIAMATHGRSGFKRFLLGSVTERVARHSSCPVLVFPPLAALNGSPREASEDESESEPCAPREKPLARSTLRLETATPSRR